MNLAAPRQRVLFVSNTAWDYLWQRHQAMASLFAPDHEVVYCEIPGVRQVRWSDTSRIVRRLLQLMRARPRSAAPSRPTGLRVISPFVLPSSNALFHAINRRLLDGFLKRQANFATPFQLVVTYSAARAALHLVNRVAHGLLIYDCTDNFSAVRGVPKCFAADERSLLQRAHLTLVPGESLARQHRATASKLAVVPHGAMVERFLLSPKVAKAHSGSPTLIYYGHIHRQHLDCTLIAEIARHQPSWRILLVGPVITPWKFPRNVELPGPQPHERLREFLATADVIILPYALNDYTRAVFPAKTFECLATGLPIVATRLPELERQVGALVTFAASPDEFIAATTRALENDSVAAREGRIEVAQSNSWDRRFEQVMSLVASLRSNSV